MLVKVVVMVRGSLGDWADQTRLVRVEARMLGRKDGVGSSHDGTDFGHDDLWDGLL